MKQGVLGISGSNSPDWPVRLVESPGMQRVLVILYAIFSHIPIDMRTIIGIISWYAKNRKDMYRKLSSPKNLTRNISKVVFLKTRESFPFFIP